jgi:hypothetical protein
LNRILLFLIQTFRCAGLDLPPTTSPPHAPGPTIAPNHVCVRVFGSNICACVVDCLYAFFCDLYLLCAFNLCTCAEHKAHNTPFQFQSCLFSMLHCACACACVTLYSARISCCRITQAYRYELSRHLNIQSVSFKSFPKCCMLSPCDFCACVLSLSQGRGKQLASMAMRQTVLAKAKIMEQGKSMLLGMVLRPRSAVFYHRC